MFQIVMLLILIVLISVMIGANYSYLEGRKEAKDDK